MERRGVRGRPDVLSRDVEFEFARRADWSRFVNNGVVGETEGGCSSRRAARTCSRPESARRFPNQDPIHVGEPTRSRWQIGQGRVCAIGSSHAHSTVPLVGSVNEFENGCDIARDGAWERRGWRRRAQVGVGPCREGGAWSLGSTMTRNPCGWGRRNVETATATGRWTRSERAIAACSLPFEVAVENLDHDFNIGS